MYQRDKDQLKAFCSFMVFRVLAEMKTQLKVFFFIVGKRVLSLGNWGLEIENVFTSVLISKWISTAPANHSHFHRMELIDFIIHENSV